MEQLGLMERFANPQLFEGLTTGEKAIGGLVTTFMGMGTTFVILFLLWGIIALISRLIQKSERLPYSAMATQPVRASAEKETAPFGPEQIAVIAAAIAAYDNGLDLRSIKISKVKQIHQYTWIKPKTGAAISMNSTSVTDVVE